MKKYIVEVRKSIIVEAGSYTDAVEKAKEDLLSDIEAWGAADTVDEFDFGAAEAD